MGRTKKPSLQVKDMGSSKGRGVVTASPIEKGQFICEYKTSRVYVAESEEAREMADIYELNQEGSYVFTTASVVPGVNKKLCFDATRRYHHPGRFINHASKGCNVKPCGPVHIRSKWRMGFVALRSIPPGEELCYDYGVRGETWMARSKLVGSKVFSGEMEDEGQVAGKSKGRAKKIKKRMSSGKRRYVWCPMKNCPSGPVKKVTQHLASVHKLDKLAISKHTRTKRYATPEAVRFRIPNPHTRSSAVCPLPLVMSSKSSPSTSKGQSTSASCTTSGELGCHSGGEFLTNLSSYLASTPGGNRGKEAVKQIVTNVGKYLHYLNSECVEVNELLTHSVVMKYIKAVEGQGIGCSGVLQKLDAHSLSLKFFRLSVEDDESLRKVERMLSFLVDIRKSYKKEKRKKQRHRIEATALQSTREDLDGVGKFLHDRVVTDKFFQAATKLLQGSVVNVKHHFNKIAWGF